jgi:hypothetical protein
MASRRLASLNRAATHAHSNVRNALCDLSCFADR